MLPVFEEFCELVKNLKKSNAEKALAVLWYFDHEKPGSKKSAGELTKLLMDHHIGTPNQTALVIAIGKTKLANKDRRGFCLRPGSRKIIRDWFPELAEAQPRMDHAFGYLPEPVWKDTRGYVEKLCRELNGTFKNGYYNSAAVMLRKLLETLIIESYEFLKREQEIKDESGEFLMLRDLVERACGEGLHQGLGIGRDSKRALKDARDIGNWSAHARRFSANPHDLTKFQSGIRLLVEELISISNLQKSQR